MIRPLNEVEVLAKLKRNIIVTDNNCWEWQGTRLATGYGLFRVLGQRLAHRVSFVLKYGTLGEGLFVCHKCDNKTCVNPDHLFLGTHQDNMDDMVVKGRSTKNKYLRTHCKNGHEFNESNTYFAKLQRQCRACTRERMQKVRVKKRQHNV